ncbi:unnamed protein product [Pleuronectes platessa]|uniref:Uncharacterized protein n=1 Tax=Pleuronectes platessa TaxID=8262 RepID=A0A9N7TLR1_PLEPL|nr:unnamed protein product [Pleuronectes platessa]
MFPIGCVSADTSPAPPSLRGSGRIETSPVPPPPPTARMTNGPRRARGHRAVEGGHISHSTTLTPTLFKKKAKGGWEDYSATSHLMHFEYNTCVYTEIARV